MLALLNVLYFNLQAQDPIEHFEFVSIKKPNRNKLVYKFRDEALQTISIRVSYKLQSKQNTEPGDGSPSSSDFLQAFFSTSPTSVEVVCNPIGNIICNKSNLSWEVPVFCPGIMQTVEDTIVRGHALRSFTTMNWKEGTNGFILEKEDTIGYFTIISDPRTNQKVRAFNEIVFSSGAPMEPEVEEKIVMKKRTDIYVDYGIIGGFRGEQFVLLFNGALGQAWLFGTTELRMVFYSDIDDFNKVKKKQRLTPSLEWNTPGTDPEKHDLMRIAIMSRYLSNILTKGYY